MDTILCKWYISYKRTIEFADENKAFMDNQIKHHFFLRRTHLILSWFCWKMLRGAFQLQSDTLSFYKFNQDVLATHKIKLELLLNKGIKNVFFIWKIHHEFQHQSTVKFFKWFPTLPHGCFHSFSLSGRLAFDNFLISLIYSLDTLHLVILYMYEKYIHA